MRGDHPPSLSTPQRPIANQYREGKVKSTPTRGVKQFLKPDAYQQWEPAHRAGDRVPFVLWVSDLKYRASLSRSGGGAAKASLNRAKKEFDALDPKPSDLVMSRLKAG